MSIDRGITGCRRSPSVAAIEGLAGYRWPGGLPVVLAASRPGSAAGRDGEGPGSPMEPEDPRRSVAVMGRPAPDDPADAHRMISIHGLRGSVARGLGPRDELPPFAVEAESGGGRISLATTVDHLDLVAWLALGLVAAETTRFGDDGRMALWLTVECGNGPILLPSAQSRLLRSRPVRSEAQPLRLPAPPPTPERFIGELRATSTRPRS